MALNKEHLTDEILDAFSNNRLEYEEYLQVLEHISSCDDCLQLYYTSFTNQDIIATPHYLKQSIMDRVHKEKQVVELIKKQDTSLHRQLFFYSVKVGLAMCGAILIIFSGLLESDYSSQLKNMPIVNMSTIDNVNNKLYEFSNKLIIMEEKGYDKEKK